MDGYRKENKYIVGDGVLLDVRNRISTFMPIDHHQKGDHYVIRSVYFDSPSHACLKENEAGVSTREKYRIRSYDCNDSYISAEIKIRHRDTISKMSTPVSRSLVDALISNDRYRAIAALEGAIKDAAQGQATSKTDIRVLEKYLAKILTENFSPACIVAYERCAFVYNVANVRITFDRNTYSSTEYDRMFDPDLTGRPAIDGNRHILEIKYDEFLPDEIATLLGGMRLARCASSKYAMCMAREIC